MKNDILNVIDKYLTIYPDEKDKQQQLLDFVKTHTSEEIRDWNNFDGHIVVSGFVYAKNDQKFLVLYHNDFKLYVYPGGHIDATDNTILDTAKREIKEETGLENLELFKLTDDEMVPLDIDKHRIRYNERLNLPEHYHFDFRFLFFVDKISDIVLDKEESSDYKWIDIDELSHNNYGSVAAKILKLIDDKRI